MTLSGNQSQILYSNKVTILIQTIRFFAIFVAPQHHEWHSMTHGHWLTA